MRLTLFLIFIAVIGTSASTSAQLAKFNLNYKETTIKQILKDIKSKSDYEFVYSNDDFDADKTVDLKVTNGSVYDILNDILDDTGMKYNVVDNVIIISPEAMKGFSQTGQEKMNISGEVLDGNGDPLPGVSVHIKGTTIGTITGFEGEYSLSNVEYGSILVFSFIGMLSQEIEVAVQSIINVILEDDAIGINEVVVTALSIERNKNSLGYSITQVGGDDINQAKENNPVNSLAGKVAGLQITKAPTGVDGSSRVILRGVASLLGNNRPLFVIDGIPMDAGYGGGGRWGGKDSGDALSDLNPEDIESMSVLKGAGAAAAYGSRGANGVILVTTKKGKNRKGIGVSISSGFSIETPMVYPDFQYDYAQGAFGMYPNLNGAPGDHPWIWSYGPKIEGFQGMDWLGNETTFEKQPNPYKEFFRTGSSLVNTISLDGGNEITSFRASITHQDSKGIMPNNGLNRQTINLRGTSKLGENLNIDGKLTYIRSKVENRPYLAEDGANIVQVLNILPRNVSLESLRNNTVDELGNERKWTLDHTFSNPYWILENQYNEDEKNRLQGMFSVNWDFAKNLKMMLRSGFDFSNKTSLDWENPGRPNLDIGTGRKSQGMSNNIEWNTDFLMTYKKKWDDINFDISLGGNYRYNEYKSISQSGSVMRIPDFYHISNYKNYSTGEWYSEKAVYSAYALGTISYKNFLYLDLTARNDWASTLPLNNNSYFYHSENISFLFSEAFGLKKDILNTGKLRASFAKVGNDTDPYQIAQYYGISQTQTDYPLASIGGQLPHFDLMPEETSSWEVGTNLSFFNNKLVFDATYYHSVSDKQIMNVDLAPSTSYSSKKMNAGKIQNTGVELQLNTSPLSGASDLKWDVILTWSKNKSVVKELYGDVSYLPLADEFHMTIEAHVDRPYGEMYLIDFKRDEFGNKLIDDNGYSQAGERKAMGNINPDWIGGLTNQLSYKGLNLSFLIDFQKGGDIYSWGKAYRALFGTSVETLEGREGWYATHQGAGFYERIPKMLPEGFVEEGILESYGIPNDIPIQPAYRWYNLYNNKIGAEWLMDASNVRLREVVLAYSLPSRWLKKGPIRKINVSLVGRNLLFFYKAIDHVDPESGFNSGNTGSGIEHLSLPSTSSYGVNFKINF